MPKARPGQIQHLENFWALLTWAKLWINNSGTVRNSVKKIKKVSMRSDFLNAQKAKQSKTKNPQKPPNSSAGWELLLFVIYRIWVGREGGILGPDRPGAASIQSIPAGSLASVTKTQLQVDVPTNPIPPSQLPTNQIHAGIAPARVSGKIK